MIYWYVELKTEFFEKRQFLARATQCCTIVCICFVCSIEMQRGTQEAHFWGIYFYLFNILMGLKLC